MDIETSKNLGGIGALLIVIAGLGFFGSGYAGLLGIVGVILVLVALKGFADAYGEGGILTNAVYSLLTLIVGAVVVVGVMVASVLFWISSLPFDFSDPNSLSSYLQTLITDMDTSALMGLLGMVAIVLVLAFVFAVLAAFFFRRSLHMMSAKTNVGMFSTAGLLMLIGAILIIAFGIGLVLIWIGFILLTIAFFTIRAQAPPPPAPQPPSQ